MAALAFLLFVMSSFILQAQTSPTDIHVHLYGISFNGRLQSSKKIKTGSDYEEPGWLNRCSLRKPGPMTQINVPGCGDVELKCLNYGCLRILKVLYSCEEKSQSNPDQLSKVKGICEKEETCTISASRKMFGNTECPNSPDSDMKMWITYSCDQGDDKTRINKKRCSPKGGSDAGHGQEIGTGAEHNSDYMNIFEW